VDLAGWKARAGEFGGWLGAYYSLGTLAFAAADLALGANLRAVALAGRPGLRAAWYALCLACFAIGRRWPGWAEAAGLAESSANLLLLVLSVFLPYLALAEAVSNGALGAASPFTPAFLVNFALSSAVAIALFPGALGPTRRRRPARG
jgi:hypothetical protein